MISVLVCCAREERTANREEVKTKKKKKKLLEEPRRRKIEKPKFRSWCRGSRPLKGTPRRAKGAADTRAQKKRNKKKSFQSQSDRVTFFPLSLLPSLSLSLFGYLR